MARLVPPGLRRPHLRDHRERQNPPVRLRNTGIRRVQHHRLPWRRDGPLPQLRPHHFLRQLHLQMLHRHRHQPPRGVGRQLRNLHERGLARRLHHAGRGLRTPRKAGLLGLGRVPGFPASLRDPLHQDRRRLGPQPHLPGDPYEGHGLPHGPPVHERTRQALLGNRPHRAQTGLNEHRAGEGLGELLRRGDPRSVRYPRRRGSPLLLLRRQGHLHRQRGPNLPVEQERHTRRSAGLGLHPALPQAQRLRKCLCGLHPGRAQGHLHRAH